MIFSNIAQNYLGYIVTALALIRQYSSSHLIRPPCLPRSCGHSLRREGEANAFIVAAAKIMATLERVASVESGH